MTLCAPGPRASRLSRLVIAAFWAAAGASASCSTQSGGVSNKEAEEVFVRGATIRFEESDTLAGRIGDFAFIAHGNRTVIAGVGIVVGLSGTGDTGKAHQEAMNLASSLPDLKAPPGVSFEEKTLAMVVVEARLDRALGAGAGMTGASVRPLGNASSLEGGTLLWTDLVETRSGEVLAVAFGPVLTSVADSKGERVLTPTFGRLLRIEVRDSAVAGREWTMVTRIAWKELREAIAKAVGAEFPGIGISTAERQTMRLELPDDPTLYPEDWRERILDLEFSTGCGGLPRILADAKSGVITSIGSRVYVNRGTFMLGGRLKVVSFAPHGPPKPPAARDESGDASDAVMIEVVSGSSKRQIKTIRWLRHVTRVMDRLGVPFEEIRHWMETTSSGGGLDAEVIRADGLLK